MSIVTGKPYAGPLEIKLDGVKEHLIDLPEGATQRLRSEQDGIEEALDELKKSIPAYGEDAGIPAKVSQGIFDDTEAIEKLDVQEGILEKALEVVRESKAKLAHERENKISQVVDAVKSTAKRTGDKAILAGFERIIKYNSQIAEKAARTRKLNAAAQAEADGQKGGGEG